MDKKYKRNIQQYSQKKTEIERHNFWKNELKVGNVSGAFWVLLSHPDTSEALFDLVYGEIHMLSHISGASLRVDIQKNNKLKNLNQLLNEKIKKNSILTNKKLNKKNAKINALKSQCLMLSNENKKLLLTQSKQTANQYRPKQDMMDKQVNINLEQHKLSEKKWTLQLLHEEEKRQKLEQTLEKVLQEKQVLETSLLTILKQKNNVNEENTDACSSYPTNKDLCGRCVLYIGGRSKQYSYFRTLVQHKNGRFIHHDGGRESSHQHLIRTVNQADVVLCPLDCVSHTAMNIVKRHCKHHTKPLVFIPRSSLSAFAKGLDKLAINDPTT